MDLLLEIGTEELPASAVNGGIAQLEGNLPSMLEHVRLDFDSIRVMGSPRRLAALVAGLPEATRGAVHKKKGPPLSAARNADGSWSPAAQGFARSQGVETENLVVEETPGGEYMFVITETEGEAATEALTGLLEALVRSLRFGRSMRWGEGEERFSRPVRWLVAMLDEKVLDFGFGELRSSDWTYGHRYLSKGALQVPDPSSYERILEEGFVVADHDRRRQSIIGSAETACAGAGLLPVLEGAVLDEVVQLVEWPGVLLGRFEDRFLELPREVLVHAMEDHQRYFPVEGRNGEIQACFLAVHNGDPAQAEVIRTGHERVLAARLADAEFFYREDLKRPLAERLKELEHVVYQSELGSMAEKSGRLSTLVTRIGESLGLEVDIIERARRAASIAKCDLVTHMVVEFPVLQGIVGSIYARQTGEDERVAAAVAEQYLPRRLGDVLPATVEGALLSLAEKADNLAASFGLGHVPTGSEDPYALRRQSLGMCLIMIDRGFLLSVTDMVRASAAELAAEAHGFTWSEDAERAFYEFFTGRERVYFNERGNRYDLVEAVLHVDWDRPLTALRRLEALGEARDSGQLERLYTCFERCHNISRGQETGEVSLELLSEDAELEVYRILVDVEKKVEMALGHLDYSSALEGLAELCGPIDTLFDEILIMADDLEVRRNRLSLLAHIDELHNLVADFTVLTWD